MSPLSPLVVYHTSPPRRRAKAYPPSPSFTFSHFPLLGWVSSLYSWTEGGGGVARESKKKEQTKIKKLKSF
jgi:hypothetical protein